MCRENGGKTMKARNIIYTLMETSNSWEEVFEKIKSREHFFEKEMIPPQEFICLLDETYIGNLKHIRKPPFGYLKLVSSEISDCSKVLLLGKNSLNIENYLTVEKGTLFEVKHTQKKPIAKEMQKGDAYKIALTLCDKVALCETEKSDEKKCKMIISYALMEGKDIFAKPTTGKSFNNSLIKQGAFLIDEKEDLD